MTICTIQYLWFNLKMQCAFNRQRSIAILFHLLKLEASDRTQCQPSSIGVP